MLPPWILEKEAPQPQQARLGFKTGFGAGAVGTGLGGALAMRKVFEAERQSLLQSNSALRRENDNLSKDNGNHEGRITNQKSIIAYQNEKIQEYKKEIVVLKSEKEANAIKIGQMKKENDELRASCQRLADENIAIFPLMPSAYGNNIPQPLTHFSRRPVQSEKMLAIKNGPENAKDKIPNTQAGIQNSQGELQRSLQNFNTQTFAHSNQAPLGPNFRQQR
jgi:hypothetical protein